ncbi:MAG: 4'-phosphopantetheinyl transferase superfamily protein [Anaeromyxobacter sp.]
MIHWALRSDREVLAEAGEAPEAWLTGAERERLGQLRVPRRRLEWLVGRLVAKSVVARALAEIHGGRWPPPALEILPEVGGRPVVRLAPGAEPVAGFTPGDLLPVTLSISHTEGHAMCAAAVGAGAPGIGIDLGRIEPRSPAFLETFLTAAEQAFVRGSPDGHPVRANLVWCGKEAALKALGLGLTVDTLLVSCLPSEPGTPRRPGRSPRLAAPGTPSPSAATTPSTPARRCWGPGGCSPGSWPRWPASTPARPRACGTSSRPPPSPSVTHQDRLPCWVAQIRGDA